MPRIVPPSKPTKAMFRLFGKNAVGVDAESSILMSPVAFLRSRAVVKSLATFWAIVLSRYLKPTAKIARSFGADTIMLCFIISITSSMGTQQRSEA